MLPIPIRKVLVANRGEIAVRIMRACRELGIATVAVYSDADRASLHVQYADEAYRLGPAPATESYLRGDLILEIARRTNTDAIHPGYGFLSENASFARMCRDAGVTFIGPGPEAMRALGSKTAARRLADEVGMPRTPGSRQALASYEEAVTTAAEIGYPIMLKAAAGGGGKGMRRVDAEATLKSSLEAAQSEAERSFGSSEVYIEKLVLEPRHIEIQLLADSHGTCVYLGERECSVQRRNQKVIEEAPSAVVSPELRQQMGEAAVKLAQAAGYVNAGTIEFLLDKSGAFYFLEMNTRLQVEHPVTELVCGLDLVHLQLHIASGQPLPFSQADVRLRGHAIECRIYAEDPDSNFMPSPGKITRYREPAGPGVRMDAGVYEGWTVPLDYDPMLAKLITYAQSRPLAIQKMLRALGELEVAGIASNTRWFERILSDPDFQKAEIHTGWLDARLQAGGFPPVPALADAVPQEVAVVAAALLLANDPVVGRAPEAAQSAPRRWQNASRQEGLRA